MKHESWDLYGKLQADLNRVRELLQRLETKQLSISVDSMFVAGFLNADTRMHLRTVVLEGLKLTQRQLIRRMEDL